MRKTIFYLVLTFALLSCEEDNTLIALFQFTPTSPQLNESVLCNNVSQNAYYYSWTVTFEPMMWNPNVTYNSLVGSSEHLKFRCENQGTYTVTLQVWNKDRTSSESYTKELQVR